MIKARGDQPYTRNSEIQTVQIVLFKGHACMRNPQEAFDISHCMLSIILMCGWEGICMPGPKQWFQTD